MDYREKQRTRKEESDREARRLFLLLSVEQVAQVATFFRNATGSPHSWRNRHYIPAGRAAYFAIRSRNEANLLPKEIVKFFAEQGRGNR